MSTMARYRETARLRAEAERAARAARYERGWRLAERAAALLREEFGASRVVVFGSLVNRPLFHARSDVDLAVWGLDEQLYYRAVAHLLGLDSEISIDLVEAERAPPRLHAVIETEGKAL